MDIGLFILLNIIFLYFLYYHKDAIYKAIYFAVLLVIFIIIAGIFGSKGIELYFMLSLSILIGIFLFDYYAELLYSLIYLFSVLTHILSWNTSEYLLTSLGILFVIFFKKYFLGGYAPRIQTEFDFKSNIINFDEKTQKDLLNKFNQHLSEKIELLKKMDSEILFFMYMVSGNKIELYKTNEKKLLKKSVPFKSINILNDVISNHSIYESNSLPGRGRSLVIFKDQLDIQGIVIQPIVINNKVRAVLGIVTSNGSKYKNLKEFYKLNLSEINLLFQEIGHLKKLLWDKEEFKFFYEALEQLNKQVKIPSIAKTIYELLSKILTVEKYNFIEITDNYYNIVYSSNSDAIINKWLTLSQGDFLSTTFLKNDINVLKTDNSSRTKLNFSGSIEKLPNTNYIITIPIRTKIEQHYIAVIEVDKQSKFTKNEISMLDILQDNLEQIIENRLLLEKFSSLANRDGLTGLYNHKKIQEILFDLIKKYKKTPKEFCVFMLDIDHFKRFNDTYGHKVGDEVLKKVSGILEKTVKEKDYCGRYGGEEFIAIIQDVSLEKGIDIAQRVRKNIEKSRLDVGKDVTQITVSIGVSHFPSMAIEKDALIKKADKGLYKAKETGRNRVDIIE